MAAWLPLLGGRDTGFESARRSEENMIMRLTWHGQTLAAKDHLARQGARGLLSRLVAHHLEIRESLARERCAEEPVGSWLHGSFNLCVPVRVAGASTGRVLLRCALAHRLSGMVDEKMRCEVATYVWMQENCPKIPMPRLFGLGLPGGPHVGPPFDMVFRRANRKS